MSGHSTGVGIEGQFEEDIVTAVAAAECNVKITVERPLNELNESDNQTRCSSGEQHREHAKERKQSGLRRVQSLIEHASSSEQIGRGDVDVDREEGGDRRGVTRVLPIYVYGCSIDSLSDQFINRWIQEKPSNDIFEDLTFLQV